MESVYLYRTRARVLCPTAVLADGAAGAGGPHHWLPTVNLHTRLLQHLRRGARRHLRYVSIVYRIVAL